MERSKQQKSFTLIELLLVIAIIGILGSITFVIFQSPRAKGRDAQRIMEIDQFYKALEICYLDSGDYPNDPSFWDASGVGWHYSFSCGPCHGNFENAIQGCVDVQLEDPINESPYAYYYFYFEPSDGTAKYFNGAEIKEICKGHYALMAHLETPAFENAQDGCFDEPAPYYEYWRILGL